MVMKLCDWCGEPAVEGEELCRACLQAKRHVEQFPVQPPATRKAPEAGAAASSALSVAARGAILLGKAIAVVVLGILMVATALFGSCSTIFAIFSILNPPFFALMVIFAGFGFGVAFILFRLTQKMLSAPPKRIVEKQLDPPFLPDPALQNASDATALGDTGQSDGTFDRGDPSPAPEPGTDIESGKGASPPDEHPSDERSSDEHLSDRHSSDQRRPEDERKE